MRPQVAALRVDPSFQTVSRGGSSGWTAVDRLPAGGEVYSMLPKVTIVNIVQPTPS